MADQLIIRGAREHNLKDVSLDLPRDSLIVFTGLSGSGKSSLLAELHKRGVTLERVQAAHITHRQRSVIMFEGWDAAGKGGIIQRLTASLDPRR